GLSGDGGQATAAKISMPEAIAIDKWGSVFITDHGNGVFRCVFTSGIIKTVIGDGITGYSGDGGPATAAELGSPYGSVSFDAANNWIIADYSNSVIRKVTVPLQVNEVIATGKMSIYPNPVSDMLHVQLNGVKGKVEMALYNITGQEVMNKTTEANENIALAVNNIPAGIYILKVVAEDGSSLIKRIEVAR